MTGPHYLISHYNGTMFSEKMCVILEISQINVCFYVKVKSVNIYVTKSGDQCTALQY